MSEVALLVPGVKQLSSRAVAYTSNDLLEAFKALRAMLTLASLNV